jgi:RimJ/RimL family protein N-acetyltransferase
VLIKGEKVILREKRIEDAPEDYEWRVDDELAKLDATRPLNMSYDSFLRYTREEIAFPNPRSIRYAIDTHDGKHIGNIMYYDIDMRQGEAELGIMIGDRDYWSKQYGRDAVNTILEHIFTTTPLTRIYLHTLEWNHRARRSFAKSGFREIKQIRRSGLEFILMEVWRSDWKQMRNTGKESSHQNGTAPQDRDGS